MVELEHEGIVGYGEASMPPYLGETIETAVSFLSRVNTTLFEDPFRIEEILAEIDRIVPGNTCIKAAIDIALHDWTGKKLGLPWHRIWGLDSSVSLATSFTIGIDTPEMISKKTAEADEFEILKVKLGSGRDREIVEAVRDITRKTIRVDANQGWTDRRHALETIEWLAGKNVELVEQPMPKDRLEDMRWLHERSPLPLVADESVYRLADIAAIKGLFDGVNIKLMKCTGMHEAHTMITACRASGLKVMLGCMTETSCAISAAAQLSPLADWVDLDGALLICNDLFTGAEIHKGRIILNSLPGIGVTLKSPK